MLRFTHTMNNLGYVRTLVMTAVCFLSWMFSAHALDFTIEKVIEIGPASRLPLVPQGAWMQGGVSVLYINVDTLKVATIEGETRAITTLEGEAVYPFGWINDSTAAIRLTGPPKGGARDHRLVIVNMNSGETSLQDSNTWQGPLYSPKGLAYYCNGSEYVLFGGQSNVGPDDLFVVSWSDSGFYKVSLDGRDSVRFAPNPFTKQVWSHTLTVTPKLDYVMNDECILRVSDSTLICLRNDQLERPPEAVLCDFSSTRLNPARLEAIFGWSCDGHYKELSYKEGIIDVISGAVTLFDTLLDAQNCGAAVYSRDGRNIAVLCDKRLYILIRRD